MTDNKMLIWKVIIYLLVLVCFLFSCTKYTDEYFDNAKMTKDFSKLIELSIVKNRFNAKAIIYLREYLEDLRGKIVDEVSNEIINDENLTLYIKELKKMQEKIEPYSSKIIKSSKDMDTISKVLNLISLIALDESTLQLYMMEKIIYGKKTTIQKYIDLISQHCIFRSIIPHIIRYTFQDDDDSIASLSRMTMYAYLKIYNKILFKEFNEEIRFHINGLSKSTKQAIRMELYRKIYFHEIKMPDDILAEIISRGKLDEDEDIRYYAINYVKK